MRLQPVEMHPSIKQQFENFDRFSGNSRLVDVFLENHTEFGKLHDSLNQTIISWSLSHVFREMIEHPEIMDKFRPKHPDASDDLGFLIQAEAFNNSSTIYRTYISVVLGRTDGLIAAIGKISKNCKNPEIVAAYKLMKNDEIRHLRNAIGHGSLLAMGSVLDYSDESHSRRFSFPELEWLNKSIYAIILAAWAASMKAVSG
jgi:hypothetical protein